MKKVLSLVLAGSMVLSSMSMAFAATPAPALTDIADSDYKQAIETLVALDVVDGYEDGTFREERTVSRAEMAKMLVVTLGYGDLVAGSKSNFSDTQGHWADSYVALAAGKGIVIGTGNGTFTPDRQVSYDEAITMVVRALGYTDASNELKGMSWPTNFKVKAAELDLTDDVAMNSVGADRGGVAQLIFNAMNTELVSVNADGDVVVSKVELLSRLAKLNENFEVKPETINPDHKNYAGDIVDLESYMYQNLDVYTIDGDVVYVKGTNNLVVEGTFDDENSIVGTTLSVIDAEDDVYSYTTSGAAFMVNGVVSSAADADYDDSDVKVTVVLNAEEDDSLSGEWTVKGVVAERQTKVAQISNEYVTGKDYVDTFDLPTDDGKVDLDNITVTGDAASLEDIQEDDIVVEYAAFDDSKTKLVVSRDTVQGEITRTATGKYYVDGTAYNVNDALVGTLTFTLGDEGTFFLDNNGEIAAFEGTSGETNYAVVVGNADGLVEVDKFDATKWSIDTMPQLKLATQDDETVVYDVYVDLNSTGKDVKDSAKIGTTKFVATSGTALVMTNSAVQLDQVVEYTLNSDGQISKIKAVGANVATIDTTKSTFKLASDAVIFNADDDYAVISEDMLEDTLTDSTVKYNTDGEIVVLVTDETKAGAASTFAYVKSINPALKDGEEVEIATFYMNGEKIEAYTDGSSDSTLTASTTVSALIVDLDGNVIAKASTTSAGFIAKTATAVSTKNNMVQIDGTWLSLSADATVIEIDTADKNAVTLSDIYGIDIAGTATPSEFNYYVNEDGDIALLIIVK